MVKIIDVSKEIKMIDLNGINHAAFFVQGDEKNILIESGFPSETNLLHEGIKKLGLTISELNYFMATHIHLDHIGSAGHLAAENPRLKIFIHPVGAKHLINPAKLNASAKRAYGDRFDLIGEMKPIPKNQVNALKDQQKIELGGVSLKIHYAPGHAKHHLVILKEEDNILFPGDALGTNYPGVSPYIVTPPPDYDKELAINSIELIKNLNPSLLIYTHFGPIDPNTRPNLYENLKRQHELWCDTIQNLFRRNPNISTANILNVLLKKTRILDDIESDVRQIYQEIVINSFNLNIEGILRYLKKEGVI